MTVFDLSLLSCLHNRDNFNFVLADNRKPLVKGCFNRSDTECLYDDYNSIVEKIAEGSFTKCIAGLIPYDYAVLDIDCYKEGGPTVAQVQEMLRTCWMGEETPLIVSTPNGGYHLYARLPDSIFPSDLTVNPIKGPTALSHVELKKFGTSIHLPGNERPEGSYLVLEGSNSDLSKIYFREEFLHLFSKNAVSVSSAVEHETLSSDQLELILNGLDAELFRDYSLWRSILFASHAATQGLGLDQFKAWSFTDPKYATEEDQNSIEGMWAGCESYLGKTNYITIGTLIYHYKKYNAQLPFELPRNKSGVSLTSISENTCTIDSFIRNEKRGDIRDIQQNRQLIFRLDSDLSNMFKYDTFMGKAFYKPLGHKSFIPFELDKDKFSIRSLVSAKYPDLNNLSIKHILEEIESSLALNRYDSLCEELDKLSWDGVKRIDTWLVDYCGVEDSAYARELSRFTLLGAAKRAYKPGCEYPYVLILKGNQGIGKTALVKVLASNPTFYDIMHPDLDKTLIKMQGKWLMEMGELQTLSKRDIDSIKSFVTETSDNFRSPYDRCAVDHPRRTIFIGTTNNSEFLKDPTGERRFCPVTCKKIELGKLKANRDQLIAEAVHLVKSGVKCSFIFSKEALKTVNGVRNEFSDRGPYFDELSIQFAKGGPLDSFYRSNTNTIRVQEIITSLNIESKMYDYRTNKEIHRALKYLAFKPVRVRRGGILVRCWRKEEDCDD